MAADGKTRRRAKARRTVNAERKAPTPKAGLRPWTPHRNDFGKLLSGDLDLDRLQAIFRAVVGGEAEEVALVYERMLTRDAHIRAESRKRLGAVSGLAWEVVPATPLDDADDDFDEDLAAEICGFVRRTLRRMEGFDAALEALVAARGTGVEVAQLIWETVEGRRVPVAAEAIPFRNLRYDDIEPWRLRIRSGYDYRGQAIDGFPRGQFIVHAPEPIGGNAFAGGLYFASLLWYCVKVWDIRFLMTAVELFGQPLRIAKYPEGASSDVIHALTQTLREMGQTAAGVIPEGTSFEAITAGIGNSPAAWPQERLIALFNGEITKLWIGATLTTAMDSTGSQAAATVHQEIKIEGRDDDIAKESRTIGRDLLRPIVLYTFGEESARYVPTFRRVIERAKDLQAMSTIASTVINDLGAPVPMRYVQDELGIPLVEGTDLDAALPGRKVADPFGDFGAPVAGRAQLRTLAAGALDRIARRGSPLARLVPLIVTAVLASQAHSEQVIERFAAALARFDASPEVSGEMTAALAEAFAALPTGEMQELARQSLLAAELAGRLHATAQARTARRAHVVAAAEIDFARLPFVEAIEAFRDRIGMDPATFAQLDAQARSRAWRVAGVWDMDLLAVLHTQLAQALAHGETVRDFRQRALPSMLDRAGWTGENPWHANVVFYQNFAMAHAAGRFRQYEDLAIGYWRFRTFGDSCPICAPEAGKVYRTDDTDRVAPLHFTCDCSDEVVFDEELEDGELRQSADEPNAALAAERGRESGFAFDVRQYAALEPIDLAKYPAAYHAAFERMARQRNLEVRR